MKKNEQVYNACLYLRLSNEDGDKIESNSIQNQKMMLTEYVNSSPNIKLINVRADDGYSGTNFNRPAFKQMLEDIDKGIINCVIIKDMSRLGRNYIETGELIQRLFPKKGVRLISITENYDTQDDTNSNQADMMVFSNIINDAYAKDISYKTRSSLEIKRRNGELLPSKLPYGYKKVDNKIVIDTKVKQIVIDIFTMKIKGYNQQQIANHLNAKNILSPSSYKKTQLKSYNKNKNEDDKVLWNSVAIKRILTNEFYIGTLALGKTRSDIFFGKTQKELPKNEWVVTEDNHEPIINKSDFKLVENLLSKDTRITLTTQTVNLFSGILICPDCGANLVCSNVKKKYKTYEYFICSTHKNEKKCTSHRISYDSLYDNVLLSIKNYINEYQELNIIFDTIDLKSLNADKKLKLTKEINKVNKNKKKINQIRISLKDQLVQGVISEKDYIQMYEVYSDKIGILDNQLTMLFNQKNDLLKSADDFSWFASYLQKNKTISKLTRQLVLILINQIIIYDNKKIKIDFRFQLPHQKGVGNNG